VTGGGRRRTARADQAAPRARIRYFAGGAAPAFAQLCMGEPLRVDLGFARQDFCSPDGPLDIGRQNALER
jgi:hypothetical protein